LPRVTSQAATASPAGHLRRLVDFAEPRSDDICLDIGPGTSGLASAIRPRVRELVSATSGSLPSGTFSLVTAWLALAGARDQAGLVHDLLRVCGGRLVLADLVRTRAGGDGRAQRFRDPAHVATRTFPELLGLVERAGGRTRRLDVFTIERPTGPWLAHARDPERIRRELLAELEGGPATGARPRLIGDELWFAQSWAFVAVEPVSRSRGAAAPPRR
jgi:hypothetical protein